MGLQAKMLVFIDQVGINGDIELAWKLAMVEDPPAFLTLKDNFPRFPAAKGSHAGRQKSSVARTPLIGRDQFNAALAEIKADDTTRELLEKVSQ